MIIAPVRVLGETARALHIRWFDMRVNDHVHAWIAKRACTVSGTTVKTLYIDEVIYDSLQLKKFRS